MGLSFLTRANFREKFGDTIREVALSSAARPKPNHVGAVTGTRVAGVRCRVRQFGWQTLAGPPPASEPCGFDWLARMLPDIPADPKAGWWHVAAHPKTGRTQPGARADSANRAALSRGLSPAARGPLAIAA